MLNESVYKVYGPGSLEGGGVQNKKSRLIYKC